MEQVKQTTREMAILFIGIDLHQRKWQITIRDEAKVIWRGSIPGTWEDLQKILNRYSGYRIRAVYEAGCFGFWLHDNLKEYGVECIVTPPSLLPMEYGNKVKTDRRDSDKLAQLLAKDLLKSVYVPSEEEVLHRQAFRQMIQMVKDRVRIQNRIKSTLRLFGLRVPAVRAAFSRTYISNLLHVNFGNRFYQKSFNLLLNEYELIIELIKQQTRLINEMAKLPQYRERMEILTSTKGISLLSAMEIILELQDVSRFPKRVQIAAYVGLTPSQHSTGDHVRMGRITGISKPHLRGTIVEISWTLIRYYPIERKFYFKLKDRVGSKRAIVAVARRFIIKVRHMLLTNTSYRMRAAG